MNKERKFILEYNQYYEIPCEIHIISDIKILYDIEKLEITYLFNYSELDLMWKIFYIDCLNFDFELIKIILNNQVIDNQIIENFHNEYDTNSDKDYYYPSIKDFKKIYKLITLNNNFIKIKLIDNIKNSRDNENTIKNFLWFMTLVRFLTDIYEEDTFYFNNTIQNRKKCHNYEELKKKLLNIHNSHFIK